MNTQIQISNVTIRQNDNQLFNLNDLHKASGGSETHRPTFWLRNQQTQELIAEIEAEGKTAFTTSQGGKNRGTFVCKELVYAYATWISAKFFLLVIRTFDAVVSGSLKQIPKTQTALPNGLTLEQQDEIKKFHRELVQAAPKEQQRKLAVTLWSSIKSKFGVSYKNVPSEHYPEVLSLMARVAVEKTVLHGEVLDKPQNHTVALPEFELVRIAQYLSKTYLSMQLFHELHRALCMVSPHFTKRTREEVENNLPLLRGIVHHLQDYSGSLKDPFFNQQFDKSMKFLGGITPRCLEFR